MKRIVVLIVTLLLVLSTASAAAVPSIDVSISKYEPFPAQPGKYIDVWVKVENAGSDDAKDVVISFIPSYPFSVDFTESDVRSLGTIRGGQFELEKFKVLVDEGAVQGDNILKIGYKFQGFLESELEFDVAVQTLDPVLGINKIVSFPENLIPGKVSQLTLSVENMADSFLRDISVKLNLENESTPFVPADSISEKRIYQLSAGTVEDIVFNLLTLSDAEGGIYKVPLTITYSDSTGNVFAKDDIIGFKVGGEPELKVILDDSEIKKADQSGTVSVLLVNSGLTDIKLLNVKVLESDNYLLIDGSEQYIGDVDSDDTESLEFLIYSKPGISELNLDVEIDYLDVNNNEYLKQFSVNVPIYSSSELSKFGIDEGVNYWVWALILVIVGAVGYWVYKKYFKKR